MFQPLKITFHLAGDGIVYDPDDPMHLDGLLAALRAKHHHGILGGTPARDERPHDIPLPLAKWTMGSHWGWRASALLIDDDIPQINEIRYWHKRLRVEHVHMSVGSPNTQMGAYRDWQSPLNVLLVPRLVAYAVGERREIRQELRRHVRSLGRKRSLGYGAVVEIECEPTDEDWSCVKDGCATRYLPVPNGPRYVRTRPPYWNMCDRTHCCHVGGRLSEELIDEIRPWGAQKQGPSIV